MDRSGQARDRRPVLWENEVQRVSNILGRILEWASGLGAVALIAISILVSVDVSMRWTTGRSIAGVFEVSSVLLVMATFLPLGLVLFRHEQLRVDIIFDWVRGRVLTGLAAIDVATGLIVFGVLLWISTEEFQKAYNGRFLLRGMIEIPTWIPLAMIWVGTALVMLTLLFQGIEICLQLLGRRPNPGPASKETDGER